MLSEPELESFFGAEEARRPALPIAPNRLRGQCSVKASNDVMTTQQTASEGGAENGAPVTSAVLDAITHDGILRGAA